MTAAGAVCWTVLTLASPQPQPAAPGQPRPATGLIVGRVIDGGTGRPVSGAIVTPAGAARAPAVCVGAVWAGAGGRRFGGRSPPWEGAPARQPRAMTNTSGQFVFRK